MVYDRVTADLSVVFLQSSVNVVFVIESLDNSVRWTIRELGRYPTTNHPGDNQ